MSDQQMMQPIEIQTPTYDAPIPQQPILTPQQQTQFSWEQINAYVQSHGFVIAPARAPTPPHTPSPSPLPQSEES